MTVSNEPVKLWTKTETLRRLRAAAKLGRELDRDLASNYRVEVGTRAVPVYSTGSAPDRATSIAPGDDLDDFGDLRHGAGYEQVRGVGYVAHLYYSSNGEWASLETTHTVWLGDETHEPALVSVPGWIIATGKRGYER